MSAEEAKIEKKTNVNVETKSGNVSKELSQEISESIDEVMAEISKENKEDADDNKSGDKIPSDKKDDGKAGDEDIPENEENGDEEDNQPAGEEIPDDKITDELLERAVKSGISMSEAKKFTDSKMLSHICDRMDELHAKTVSGNDQPDNGKDSGESYEEDDLLKDIPDLDPEEFDEEIVKGFSALKGVVGKLIEENKNLKLSGKKSEEQSFFDSKVSELDKDLSKAIKDNPDKKSALKKEFDILAAGYKAVGDNISKDDIFNKAVTIALGDVKKESAKAKKTEQLKARNDQFISRPGGSKTKPTADPFDEVAEKLDRKFFGKS